MAWQQVAAPLRTAGHAVYPVTLTGLGERSHLADGVKLSTHIDDIVNLLRFEQLRDVTLVGHSYGGTPVTGVADRVPELLSRVVYLESGPTTDGASQRDLNPPEVWGFIERRVREEGNGQEYPMPTWDEIATVTGASIDGLGEAERAEMRGRAVAQPLQTMTEPLRLGKEGSARDALPKALIACSFSLTQVRSLIAAGHPWFVGMDGPQWSLYELTTGHWPMFSRPRDLAALLADLA